MCVCVIKYKVNDFTRFFSKNKVTQLLIQKFYFLTCEIRRVVNLNECLVYLN